MKTQQLDTADTAPLPRPRAPRRLPPLHWPAWVDRAADHPRACWTVTAVCTAAALALLAVMATGALYPVTDWNGPRYLKPGIPSPTIAAPPATERPTTVAAPAARPSQRPTRTDSPTSTTGTTTAPTPPQTPAQQPTPPPRTTAPAPPDGDTRTGPPGGDSEKPSDNDGHDGTTGTRPPGPPPPAPGGPGTGGEG